MVNFCGCTCACPIHVGNDSGAINIADVNRWDKVEVRVDRSTRGNIVKNDADASGVLDRQALVNASVIRRRTAALANYDLASDLGRIKLCGT